MDSCRSSDAAPFTTTAHGIPSPYRRAEGGTDEPVAIAVLDGKAIVDRLFVGTAARVAEDPPLY